MNRLLFGATIAMAVAGCGKKKEQAKPKEPAPAVAVVDAGAVVDAAAAAAPAKRAAITREVRAEYKKRLAAGRKLAKAAKWPEAIAELQAALAAIPGDDRALAELSFAAMSAGDRDLARKAGRQAVLVSTEPNVKSAALYNLGRTEETEAPAAAAALYRTSLTLRPNATVEKRLADLVARGNYAPEPLPCAQPAAIDKVCACLNATAVDVDPDVRQCDLAATAVDGFQLARFRTSELGEDRVLLVGKGNAGWAVVADVAYIYNPGAFGISEDWSLDSVAEEKLGTRTVVKVTSKKSRHDSDMGVDEEESEDSTDLVVCVRDPAGGLPTCPLSVRTDYVYDRDRMGLATDEEMADIADELSKDLPIHREVRVSVELKPDGVAAVRAVQGRPDPAALGDKKLW